MQSTDDSVLLRQYSEEHSEAAFATLVTRMRTDDDEDDDPGRGAVV